LERGSTKTSIRMGLLDQPRFGRFQIGIWRRIASLIVIDVVFIDAIGVGVLYLGVLDDFGVCLRRSMVLFTGDFTALEGKYRTKFALRGKI
jgi:hypothetical protein